MHSTRARPKAAQPIIVLRLPLLRFSISLPKKPPIPPRFLKRRRAVTPRHRLLLNIDVMLAKRKMSLTELAEKVGITTANMSILKTGKAKAIKISTLTKLCEALECQPGDILEYREGKTEGESYE